MMDIDTLVGRLMDLETKFYELQDRYQSLINDYEKLKEEHIPDGNWQSLTDEEKANLVEDNDWYNYPEFLVEATEEKVKAKNEKNCARHRNQHGTRYDSPSGDAGH